MEPTYGIEEILGGFVVYLDSPSDTVSEAAQEESVEPMPVSLDDIIPDDTTQSLCGGSSESHCLPALTHKCSWCRRCFMSLAAVQKHEKTHTTVGKWACTQCSRTYHSKQSRHTHAKSHKPQDPFKCTHCRRRFATLAELHQHQMTHTATIPCPQCDMMFFYQSQLKLHLPKHSGMQKVECEKCGKRYKHNSGLYSHQRAHPDCALGGGFVCTICSVFYRTRATLHKHRIRMHGVADLTCDQCGISATTPEALDIHRAQHIIMAVPDSSNVPPDPPVDAPIISSQSLCANSEQGRHTCAECDFWCYDDSDFKRHMFRHTRSRPLTCPHCNNTYLHLQRLRLHQKYCVHPDAIQRPRCNRLCPICQQVCSTTADLRDHLAKHARPIICCAWCDKQFATAEKRNTHERRHTVSMEFACARCPETFSLYKSYHDHIESHPIRM